MSQLDTALAELRGHPGVAQLILLGRDGLVVQSTGAGEMDEESVAARIPGIEAACRELGRTGLLGTFSTAVMEYEHGVAIVVSLQEDLLLAALVEPGVGFAPLLRDLRRQRENLAELL